MKRIVRGLIILAAILIFCVSCPSASAQGPLTINGVSPTSGPVGTVVTITGLNFGTSQANSTVSLNGTAATVTFWSDTTINAVVPSGATSGAFTVTVNGESASSVAFTITSLPSNWTDADVGPVGIAGSATFANGVFTVKGSGTGIAGTSDEFHFLYQSLSGDGTIVARVASCSSGQCGVMIRETLNANATDAFLAYLPTYTSAEFYDRASTGGSTSNLAGSSSHSLPYWVEVVRSGNTFSTFASLDGTNWTQVGSNQTITMATGVYIGLGVSSQSNSTLATATFDNVSVSSAASPAPQITQLSATTGPVGTQVVISGTGFGSSQGGSIATLNGSLSTVSSWSATSISITIPTGATSGPMVVSVAPSMNDSNPFNFAVTTQPLPTSWLDEDVGAVGALGSATYANGVFTVKGAGTGMSGTSDQFHFVYQPLSGDGTIVARVAGCSTGQCGVMIRETLNPNARDAFLVYLPPYTSALFYDRANTGGSTSNLAGSSSHSLPYWVEVVRSGNTFSTYVSLDGTNWTQVGSNQTITMATGVYIGLGVSSQSNSTLATATFDNVSVSSAANPAPVITSLSATAGPIGASFEINGSGFGASQGSSIVTLGGTSMTIDAWTNTVIEVTVPSGATSGSVVVTVAPTMNNSNPDWFEVTTQALPSNWLDDDVGTVPTGGSATYANGTYTVSGTGRVDTTPDYFHFVYQALSGDGSIVARVVSRSGYTYVQAGVMIRETLIAGATDALTYFSNTTGYGYIDFSYRGSAGGSIQTPGSTGTLNLPYWVKLVRSGNTFSSFVSWNGIYWTQVGSSQTITMATNAYIGLFVASAGGSSLATATFDNVSISSTSAPAPLISSISPTTGSAGTQVAISGSNFGAAQNGDTVFLNGTPMTINAWSSTSITATVPSGATTGPLAASVGPSMNDSNPIYFEITSQPLPTPWLNADIGGVTVAGSATYSSGTFTISGAGSTEQTPDSMQFVYQPLSGDGSITARIVSESGASGFQAAAMIHETLTPSATDAFPIYSSLNGSKMFWFMDRPSTGANVANQGNTGVVSLPYWVKLVRNGNTFSGYYSSDGSTWTQIDSNLTITMATNAYIGLAVTGGGNSASSTFTFDNVSMVAGTTPVVSGLSPVLGGWGTSVTITGSNFGSSQGTSTVAFNGTAATSITSWSASQIIALVPSGATTGPVAVTVSNIQSVANPTFTVIHPVITSLTPPTAEVGGQITINGSGFGASSYLDTVSFNGVNTTPGTLGSDTAISVAVPATATTGPLTVTVNGVTSNSVTFTVEPLSVTGISPSSGESGNTVTISGAGFGSSQSDSVVTFDGVTATASSWGDSSIQAVVPAGAATGPVTVEVANKTALGPTFTITGALQLTDSLGNQSTYAGAIVGGNWDIATAQGSGCSSCTLRGNITYQYDSLGNVLSTTDELGNVTSYTFDSNSNVISVTQPAVGGTNPKTTYTYNGFGEVLTMTDPLGNVTSNTYDSHGNLLTVTTPAPNNHTAASVTQFAYNSLGELTQITDPLGRITKITYTTAGYIATITDPQNNVTTYGYDSRGNRTSVTDALNKQTTFAYDSGNRLTGITYPDTSTASFTYDSRGRRITATDQNGKTTTYAYDDADRLTSVTDPAGNVTQYAYDTENNLLSITDANSHTTNFAYDAFGRVTKTTFPSGYIETYGYDADNNLTSKTDRKNQTINYVYDALNRLTQKTYPDSTTAAYTYDLVSKILQVNDPTGTYAFAYDNMGRLTGTTTTYSILPNTPFINSYSYDADSNRTGFTAPDGSTNTYSYDTLNRLATLANSWAGSFGFSYDALSRRTQMTRPNNITTNYTYDTLSRLLSVLHQAGTSTIDGDVYTLDASGNRTAKQDDLAGVTSNYTYDKLYELTQATQGTNTTESYSYDAVGNRLSSLGVSPYSYNTSNELTSTPSGSYTYDYNGNTLTDASGRSYAWDFENRLTQVTMPNSGGTATFKYDPFGRRIQKVFTQNSTTTTNYLYDGDNAIETVDQNGSVVAKYAQGQNIDEPLAESVGGTTYDYEQDGLGSATSLTNSSGALALTNTYDSFGKITASSGSVTNPFRYTGRDFDSETGLYYYRARYYDPQVGRFMSEDPIEFDGGADFYAYSDNDPVLYTDASGLIHYNAPPPRTVPPTGKTLQALNCLEHCLQCVTHNPDLNLLVTGGSEQSGHTRHSYHYLGQAVDIAGPYFNPVGTRDVYACGEQCGFTAGQFETFPANPFRNHWHLQITPGNGVPLLPPLLPVAPRPQR